MRATSAIDDVTITAEPLPRSPGQSRLPASRKIASIDTNSQRPSTLEGVLLVNVVKRPLEGWRPHTASGLR